ncbi:ATP-binding cassette, subfamily B [Aristaeella hokkaidonensis]|uniref:ABC transporter ATP-binding protein n=2 Tax=Aristaeella hokkaidonensis TaxID=3046382 RepID=A0AC61MZ60_9FIRM|nr:ABC transporter ATP-binding protein [Aristaeella hokkaidonensis]QUC68507.1 ABC transporter ATP-binding protein [Aristaeella hokkaidonensis]SNT94985.1 ATP-binding cassette, subfamily B [Aristaeella hokkaidonensis]
MRHWMKYIKPYKAWFILGPLCMIVEVIGEVLMPMLLARVINAGNMGTLTVGSSIGTAGLMILIAVFMMAGGIGGCYFSSKASIAFAGDIRNDLYSKIQRFSFGNIDRFSTGSLVTRVTNDVTQMQNFVAMLMRMALRAPGMMIGGLIMAIRLRPDLATIFWVSIPALLLFVGGNILTAFPRFKEVQAKVDGLNSTVQENITNVRVVKSFVREEDEIKKFGKANSDLKNAAMRAMRIVIQMQPVTTLMMYITVIGVAWQGHALVLNGEMAVGDLSAFVNYVIQILSSLIMVTFLFMMSSRAMASAKRIREVLEEEPDLNDDDAKQKDLTVKEGSVEFRHVSFRYYKHSEDSVLEDISLTIEPGTIVGIIGSTGCGKSTLVSMIPRLYDPDEGEILVDGVNVRDYSLYNLREGVGMVLQKNVLFSGTVAENLRWGDENATDEEMIAAAKSSQADKFVSSFTDGYESNLDKGGNNLSGGQKQRLCIARALLKKPKILILDDSTSAVDTATEAQIRNAFSNELAGSTKIIIAQRIASVMDADQIIVMNEGRITGVGTHDELLASNTEYREIAESQLGKKGA